MSYGTFSDWTIEHRDSKMRKIDFASRFPPRPPCIRGHIFDFASRFLPRPFGYTEVSSDGLHIRVHRVEFWLHRMHLCIYTSIHLCIHLGIQAFREWLSTHAFHKCSHSIEFSSGYTEGLYAYIQAFMCADIQESRHPGIDYPIMHFIHDRSPHNSVLGLQKASMHTYMHPCMQTSRYPGIPGMTIHSCVS